MKSWIIVREVRDVAAFSMWYWTGQKWTKNIADALRYIRLVAEATADVLANQSTGKVYANKVA